MGDEDKGKEDLKLGEGVGEVGVEWDVGADNCAGCQHIQTRNRQGVPATWSLTKGERGVFTLQLATFSPPPVKFAKGSSSSKKSGGGDLRGRERGGDEGTVDEWTCPSTIFFSGQWDFHWG